MRKRGRRLTHISLMDLPNKAQSESMGPKALCIDSVANLTKTPASLTKTSVSLTKSPDSLTRHL